MTAILKACPAPVRWCLAAMVACLVAFHWVGEAQADDPNYRFGPLNEPPTIVPDNGPILLTANKKGNVTVLSSNSPGEFSLSVARFPLRVATVVPFKFAKKTRGKIRFSTSTPGTDTLRWVTIESDDTIHSLIDTFRATPGQTTKIKFNAIDSRVPEVQLPTENGEYTIEIDAPFRGDVEYRLIFYAQGERGLDGITMTYQAFEGPEVAEPDPELKLLPQGADPTTGCPGTDLSNISAAYRAESTAVQYFESLNAVYDEATANGIKVKKLRKVKVKTQDLDLYAELLDLSIQHIECAKELVESRVDLDEDTKSRAIAELDRAGDRDRLALSDLDRQVLADGARSDLELLARLSQATLAVKQALQFKTDAARIIDPSWNPPEVLAGLSVGAVLSDAASLARDFDEQLEAALTDYREKVDRIKEHVDENGEAGLATVLASNTDPACREFLRLTLLGDLNTVAAAVTQQKRQMELEKLKGNKPDKREKKNVKQLVKLVDKSRKRMDGARRVGDQLFSDQRRNSKRQTKLVRKFHRKVSGRRGLGDGIRARKRLYDKLLGN